MKRKFLILDRDGTLIADKGYLADPDGVELIPGASEALLKFQEAGWGMIVVTNQSGVGRGFFGIDSVNRVHERLTTLLRARGIALDGIYFNTDHPDNATDDRKPGTGLVLKAAQEHGFNPTESIVVGDKDADILLARNLRCIAVLVLTGYGKQASEIADFVVPSIATMTPSMFESAAQ